MFLEPPLQEQLMALLAKHSSQEGRSSPRDQSWRDQLGLLFLGLPALLTEAEPEAVGCAHHSVILFSGPSGSSGTPRARPPLEAGRLAFRQQLLDGRP